MSNFASLIFAQASSDNSQLGSGGADTLVVLWDVATGQALRRWRKHAARVNAVRFAGPSPAEGELAPPSSPLLLSVGVDGMLLVWDARARTQYPIQVAFCTFCVLSPFSPS